MPKAAGGFSKLKNRNTDNGELSKDKGRVSKVSGELWSSAEAALPPTEALELQMAADRVQTSPKHRGSSVEVRKYRGKLVVEVRELFCVIKRPMKQIGRKQGLSKMVEQRQLGARSRDQLASGASS